MVNRRQFLGGVLKPQRQGRGAPRPREPRYRALETYVLLDRIPPDLKLTAAQDRDLRQRMRRIIENASDEHLYSMAVVSQLETLAERFVSDLQQTGES